MLTLVASALAGGDCIDDADALRAGGTGRCSRLRGQGAIHPGDLPAQLPVGACPSTRPREPPVVGPGLGRWGRTRRLALTIDLDSTICETYGLAKEGARHHGYTGKRGYHPLLAVAAGTGDVLMGPAARGPAPIPLGAPPTSCVKR